MLDTEILAGFQDETRQLLSELGELVETLEESGSTFPASELAQFAQKIDRIMGAAQTLGQLAPDHAGLKSIGALAQVCKMLGYKAVESKAAALVPIFAAFWADTIDVIAELVDALSDVEESRAIASNFAKVLQNRLTWLNGKVQGSGLPGAVASQSEIDQIVKGLGQ